MSVDGRPAASLTEIAGDYEVLEFRGAPGDARDGWVRIGERSIHVKASCNGVSGTVAMTEPGIVQPSDDEFEITVMGCRDMDAGRPSAAERRDDFVLDLVTEPFNATWTGEGRLALWRGRLSLELRRRLAGGST